MIRVFHNPRCRKSREALQLLEDNGITYEIHEYLKLGVSTEMLKELFKKSNADYMQFVRTTESEYKENFKGNLNDELSAIEAIAQYPKLLQRPIIETEKKAWIVRDDETKQIVLKELSKN